MRIDRLQVVDFRNYVEGEAQFAPGPNVLLGANGQGKTNLVEAIGYLGTLSSHRVAATAPLIRRGADRAVVRAFVSNEDRSLLIELEVAAGKASRARLNKAPVKRSRDLIGLVRSVLFAPEDLALVKGDPADRRHFLDELLILRYPRYAAVKADYDRVLKQRNALLRTAGMARRAGGGGDLRTLESWDQHLIEHGVALLHGRLALVAALDPFFIEAYAGVSGAADTVGTRYRASIRSGDLDDDVADSTEGRIDDVPTEDELRSEMTAKLDSVRAKEIERGITLVGPHRDELLLSLDDFPAKGYASHGQSWSIALALRLASYDLLKSDGAEPILLLDDVFAELDERRRRLLAKIAGSAEQTIVTAAVPRDVPDELTARTFTVTAGMIREGD